MSFIPYPAYKDTETEWLGGVPDHWIITSIKHVASINMGQSPSSDDCNIDGVGVPFLQGNGEFGLKYPTPKQYCPVARKIADTGDLLFSVRAPVGALNEADQIYGIGRGLCAVKASKKISKKFLWHFLSSSQSFLDSISTGSTFEAVSAEQVENIAITLPREIAEQTQIARFLDHETARIDALIEEQQLLIELLKEKRQAVISRIVTKGLDPAVPMKDSGVEWLGEVPAHWAVSPLKFLVEEKVAGPYGASLTKSMYTDAGYRVYGQQQVISDDFSVGDYCISEEKYREMQRYVVFPGDVLVSVMGTIGRVSVVPSDVEAGIINPRLVRYKFRQCRVIPEFVKILLMSLRYQSRLREESQGSTMEGLNMVILGDLPLVLPPLEAQRPIVAFVQNYDSSFNELVSQAASAVDLLQERRSTLISVAVTGKIDVRGWQPPISAPSPELDEEVV